MIDGLADADYDALVYTDTQHLDYVAYVANRPDFGGIGEAEIVYGPRSDTLRYAINR